MGLYSSKRVKKTLRNSQEFMTACKTVYQQYITQTQQEGIELYQIPSVYQQSITLAQQTVLVMPLYQIPLASNDLYIILANDTDIPLIKEWVTDPPTHSQIDKSIRKGIDRVGEEEFEEFAVSLYADMIVGNVEKDVLVKVVPVGVVGFGMVGIVGMNVVIGTLVGVYALGVVTNAYLRLILGCL